MEKRKHLIIGCGSAALSALKQIRKLGSEDEVKLVTMEDYSPYSPASLPYLVSGRMKESDIQLVGDDYFDQMKATLIRGRRVDSIDTRGQKVNYDNGESDTYDTLLIASGSEPVVPQVLKKAGALEFHIMDDYVYLTKRLENRTKVTILGGGLVGMELAVALSERGHEVNVIAPRERILRRYFDAEVGSYIIDLFAKNGVPVSLNWGEVIEARRYRDGIQAKFATGKRLDTRTLIACIGVKPRVLFVDGSGIRINQGILVDSRMRTNIPNVFAAGDVAEAPDFFTGNNGLNPILPTAVRQGKIAGSNMVGTEVEYEGWLPMNTFNFFGHLATSVGKSTPSEGDEVLIEKEHKKLRYKKIICRDGKLLGATFLDTNVDAGVIQYLIKERVNIDPYKELLIKKPKDVSLWLMLEAGKKKSISLED